MRLALCLLLAALALVGCVGSGIAEDLGGRGTALTLSLSALGLFFCAWRMDRRVSFTLFFLLACAA